MKRIEESIRIEAAPSDVYRYCLDPKHRQDWDARVVGIELLSNPPIRTGTLLSIDSGRGGEYHYSFDAEYTKVRSPKVIEMRAMNAAKSAPFKQATETMDFAAVGGAANVTMTWEYDPGGFFAKLMDRLGGAGATRKGIRRSLENLKRIMESR